MTWPRRLSGVAVAAATTALLVSGCPKTAESPNLPPPPNPTTVAGKPVAEGPSGLRPNPPGPIRPIVNGDNGDIDRIAGLAIADIEQYWTGAYAEPLKGKFTPVSALFSWDERYKHGKFCGDGTHNFYNAEFCNNQSGQNCLSDGSTCSPSYNTIGWDRGMMFPDMRDLAGDVAIPLVLSHEYGHAIQSLMAHLIDDYNEDTALAAEQQADCFAGVYLRWVVDDKSPRFTLNTGEGLTKILVAMLTIRDPMLPQMLTYQHGSAFERVTAFQFGFDEGTPACVKIDPKEVEQRRAKYPKDLVEQGKTGEAPINQDTVKDVTEALTQLFSPATAPTVNFDMQPCPDARPSPPASYCPSSNTISVGVDKLIVMGTRLSRGSPLGSSAPTPFGDFTAFSTVMSRYMLAVQKQRGGLSLNDTNAGLRTACLTGVASVKLAKGVPVSGGKTITLTGGDLDEAVAGLLNNGLVAADVNGDFAPSGFARVDAFRSGVLSDEDTCLKRWP